MADSKKKYPHPYIPELADELRKKNITRRDFVYTATMLGLSAGAALAAGAKGRPVILPAMA